MKKSKEPDRIPMVGFNRSNISRIFIRSLHVVSVVSLGFESAEQLRLDTGADRTWLSTVACSVTSPQAFDCGAPRHVASGRPREFAASRATIVSPGRRGDRGLAACE